MSIVDSITTTLASIARHDPAVNAFTAVLGERAINRARAIDDARAAGGASIGPLEGVPFAVKNLFDVAGLITLAGSRIERERPGARAATADATAITRLEAAGAILVGALNMDEYAYGFTTENTHYGACRNPHDAARMAGGSSGGSGAAVAAGMVAFALGTDTNGSIRVPASLCGTFGLRPTFGRLSRGGAFPFVFSLDTIGPLARTVRELALAYDAMQGPDERDPGCAQRAREPAFGALCADPAANLEGLRIARLGGWFEEMATPAAVAALDAACSAIGSHAPVSVADWPDAELGRDCAFVITAAEGGALHLDDLRHRYDAMEPHSRDRFLAGALAPAAWVHRAQRVRRAYVARVDALFAEHDILLAPAVPCEAPHIGDDWIEIRGRRFPSRPSLGLLTQPVSCAGLPVAAAPIRRDGLPIAIQVIAAPWREADALRVARALEQLGVAAAPVPAPFA
jgi:amidase/aspartyl-tRNA(Asn)/glutamyl-tRNA(Gln) amidotransferase subunit A